MDGSIQLLHFLLQRPHWLDLTSIVITEIKHKTIHNITYQPNQTAFHGYSTTITGDLTKGATV